MMKRQLFILCCALVSFTSSAQDSLSVLYIGNSYTSRNDLPDMVNELAISLGDKTTFDSHTPDGDQLIAHSTNQIVEDKLDDNPWDFVVVQAQSIEGAQAPIFFGTGAAENLADKIYAENFCSEALFFMTWGRENGFPNLGSGTFDGMTANLVTNYLQYADATDGSVSPVGAAWKYVRDSFPTINLYNPDESHPNVEGTYLAACTFYASLFRKSPVGASFTSSLDPVTAGRLQTAAATIVLTNLELWNLRPISEHTQAEFIATLLTNSLVQFTNLSSKATSYMWDFGDGSPTSTEVNPSHEFPLNGEYVVTLTAQSPCDRDLFQSARIVVDLNELDQKFDLSSFGNGQFELSTEANLVSVSVHDASGRIIESRVSFSHQNAVLDLSESAKGVYFIDFSTELGHGRLRVLR